MAGPSTSVRVDGTCCGLSSGLVPVGSGLQQACVTSPLHLQVRFVTPQGLAGSLVGRQKRAEGHSVTEDLHEEYGV